MAENSINFIFCPLRKQPKSPTCTNNQISRPPNRPLSFRKTSKKNSSKFILISDPAMKRPVIARDCLAGDEEKMMKKKSKMEDSEVGDAKTVLSDENLLYEVLKHVDARTLAAAACVSKLWNKTAQDERLWELICTEHYAKNPLQLRAVVLPLGGFRRLYSLCLWPLLKPSSASASRPVSSAWPCLPPAPPAPAKSSGAGVKTRWGKDEVNLSLSLLSIRYYEKMNSNNRGK